MMNNKVNIAVLGSANIALRSIIPTLMEMKEKYNFTGLASRSPERAKQAVEPYQANAYDGYRSAIDDEVLDAVYIPLPNALHAEWIQKALDKGLHVLVEKSMTCNLEDTQSLNRQAQEKGLILMENFQFRFHQQLQYIQQLIEEGKIGDLRCIRSAFGFPGLPDENDIRYQKDLGGGALLDTGAYPLKIAQLFMGPDLEVKAANLNSQPGKEVDIWGGAYIKQKQGGMFAEVAFGFNHHYQNSLELWGSKGLLRTNRIFTAKPDFSPVIELETAQGKEMLQLEPDNHFKNMLDHFYALINKERNPDKEYEQNIQQARLLDEVKEKAHE